MEKNTMFFHFKLYNIVCIPFLKFYKNVLFFLKKKTICKIMLKDVHLIHVLNAWYTFFKTMPSKVKIPANFFLIEILEESW